MRSRIFWLFLRCVDAKAVSVRVRVKSARSIDSNRSRWLPQSRRAYAHHFPDC
jgi:hypothetical protein